MDSEKGYVKDDSITLEVHVMAEAPHGVRLVTALTNPSYHSL